MAPWKKSSSSEQGAAIGPQTTELKAEGKGADGLMKEVKLECHQRLQWSTSVSDKPLEYCGYWPPCSFLIFIPRIF